METAALRIAMFTDNYYPFIGGVPISIDRLTQGLRAMGHSVTIFAPAYPGQSPEADPDTVRCKLLRYHKTKLFDFAVTNIFSREIDTEFAKRGFDVIHAHHPFWMGVKGLNFGKKYGIPVVYTHHTQFDQYSHYMPVMKGFFKSYISHSVVKYFSQRCDLVFSPVKTSEAYLTSLGVTTPIEILPTGVKLVPEGAGDEIRQKLAPGGETLLCSVARLAPEKNIPFLLRGINRVREISSVPFKCIVVGDGPERGALDQIVRKLNLDDCVVLTGGVPPEEVGNYIRASDLFVFASRSEVQGVALFEAMAARCPVVAVRCSGADDVIIDGFNGYRVYEDLEEWAGRVAALLSDREERQRLADNAYRHAEQFSTEAVAQQATRAYRRAIEEKKRDG
ncbi:MAG: glycosyltransferase [Oscillospiraceae bacterium]|jgi:glycosyltransferase involved in cell wall biosynthesis|nr:glycosyltransferase [Oscillospiraceae bacterium]